MVSSEQGGHKLPAQNMIDFLLNRKTTSQMKGSSPSGLHSSRLDQLFPENVYLHLVEAFERFQNKMGGFIEKHATLYGIESRTSCPVRIPRDKENLQSVSHQGLYPCGEGAGYAGGITSAACDGVRVADAICEIVKS